MKVRGTVARSCCEPTAEIPRGCWSGYYAAGRSIYCMEEGWQRWRWSMDHDPIPDGFHTVDGFPAGANNTIQFFHVAFHPDLSNVFFLAWQFFPDPLPGEPVLNDDGAAIAIHNFLLSVPVDSVGIAVPTVESEISFDVASFLLPDGTVRYQEVSQFHVNGSGEFLCVYPPAGGSNINLVYKTYGQNGQLSGSGDLVTQDDASFLALLQQRGIGFFNVEGMDQNEPPIPGLWECYDAMWGPNDEIVTVASINVRPSPFFDSLLYRVTRIIKDGVDVESVIVGSENPLDEIIVNPTTSPRPSFRVGVDGSIAWTDRYDGGGLAPDHIFVTDRWLLFYNGAKVWVASSLFAIDRDGNIVCWYRAQTNTRVQFGEDTSRFNVRLAKLDASLRPIWEHEPQEPPFRVGHIHVDDENRIYTATPAGTTQGSGVGCFDTNGNEIPIRPVPEGVEFFAGPSLAANNAWSVESLDGGHH